MNPQQRLRRELLNHIREAQDSIETALNKIERELSLNRSTYILNNRLAAKIRRELITAQKCIKKAMVHI